MEKSLFEQMGGAYTQVGDYLLPNLTLFEEEQKPIGLWGQCYLCYIKQHKRVLYASKLNSYLANVDEQSETLFPQLVKELAEKENVAEKLKAENQILWVQ